jgi:hypothetical protein
VDLVIDLDSIPINFWHRRFPKRIPRGLILAIHSALGTGQLRRAEITASAGADRKILDNDLKSAAGRLHPERSFNFYGEQYTGIHDAP